jgi:hypothetical protein
MNVEGSLCHHAGEKEKGRADASFFTRQKPCEGDQYSARDSHDGIPDAFCKVPIARAFPPPVGSQAFVRRIESCGQH